MIVTIGHIENGRACNVLCLTSKSRNLPSTEAFKCSLIDGYLFESQKRAVSVNPLNQAETSQTKQGVLDEYKGGYGKEEPSHVQRVSKSASLFHSDNL